MAQKLPELPTPFFKRPKKRKRKPTKAEAKDRIRSLPSPPPFLVPPLLRPAIKAGPKFAEVLVEVDPLDRTAPERTPTRQETMLMTTEDTVRDMVNDPEIVLTVDDLPIINDPSIIMDINGELRQRQFERAELLRTKPKRKVSKYQKELGRQLKMLKKKHPRTKVTALMKRAHRATRKALSK